MIVCRQLLGFLFDPRTHNVNKSGGASAVRGNDARSPRHLPQLPCSFAPVLKTLTLTLCGCYTSPSCTLPRARRSHHPADRAMAPSRHIAGLPMMPGNSVRDFSLTDYRRRTSLGMRSGVMQVVDPSEASKSREDSLAKTLSRKLGIADVPEHVAFDGKVLRYECFFKEAVVESNEENYRVRRCVLFFYLLDGSVQVSEPKLENSGIPQGEGKGAVFIKRHRIQKPDGSYIGISDLAVGADVTLYGRTFHLTDADAFTRDFVLKAEGRVEEPPQPTPIDPYNAKRAALKEQAVRNSKYFHPRPSEDDLMRHMEARLGASTAQLGGDKLGKFLRHDRQVLRFFLAWDDRGRIYGELRPFVLHYYLQDDEVEVLEVKRANSGRDPFPAFLKKGRLAKDIDTLIRTDAPTTHTLQLIDRSGKVDPESMRYYTETDFAVGKEIQVNGITFLIHGCDKFTREYYERVYGVTMGEIPISFDSTVVRPQVEIPPHYAGHPGTEEDSLGSFLYLTPKVPKKNFTRMMDYGNKVFRFMARLQTDRVEDVDRVFVVKYFLADDTIGVFEPPARNSGIVGGKFLERARLKKPDGTWYLQSDFYVGATITLHTHSFVLYQADEYTLALMEEEAALHPMSDIGYIFQQLRAALSAEQKDKLAKSCAEADSADGGFIGYAPFQAALAAASVELQDQALITIMRSFHASDGSHEAVAYRDFIAQL